MATHKSDIIVAKEEKDLAKKTAVLTAPKVGAVKLEDYPIHTMKGSEVANDIIELTVLPAGSALIPQRCFAAFGYPRPFNVGTLALGTPEEPSKYGYARIMTTGGPISSAFGYDGASDVYLNFPEIPVSDAPQKIVAKFVNTPSGKVTGGKLIFGMEYRIRG